MQFLPLGPRIVADTAGVGEWGFAALVEADGRRILLDTGAAPDTVLKNGNGNGHTEPEPPAENPDWAEEAEFA